MEATTYDLKVRCEPSRKAGWNVWTLEAQQRFPLGAPFPVASMHTDLTKTATQAIPVLLRTAAL